MDAFWMGASCTAVGFTFLPIIAFVNVHIKNKRTRRMKRGWKKAIGKGDLMQLFS